MIYVFILIAIFWGEETDKNIIQKLQLLADDTVYYITGDSMKNFVELLTTKLQIINN